MSYINTTPPTLPEYDTETYGFHLLVFNYRLGAPNWYMVHLYYCSWRFSYEEGVGVFGSPITFHSTYSDGAWTDAVEIDGEALALNPGLTGTVYQRIFTNANIFNGDEIWLAENTATPLDAETREINKKSQLAGYIAALCSPARYVQREPIGYLYGHIATEGETPTHTINGVGYVGVVAPDIYSVYTPELQAEKPYAWIGVNDSSYRFSFRDTARVVSEDATSCTFLEAVCYELKDGQWVACDDPATYVLYDWVWANHDVCYVNSGELSGTVFMAASEPIPIYE